MIMIIWGLCIFFATVLITSFKITSMDEAISELKREVKELKNKENEQK